MMKRGPALLVLLAPLCFRITPPAQGQETASPVKVRYSVDVTDPASGIAKIEMTVENNRDEKMTVGLPVWAPGAYAVMPYHRAVRDLKASIDGRDVDVSPTDHTSLWNINTGKASTVMLRYDLRVSAVPSLRHNLTKDHYDLQGPATYFFVKDRLDGPHQVTFKRPDGWKIATGLDKLGDATYGARDYDTFIDCPTELGLFDLHSFTHDDVRYEMAIHSTEAIDVQELMDVTRRIVAEQTRMFGGAPFDRYVFLCHFRVQSGGGGLEHLNSTHISMPVQAMKADPKIAASLISHEFFHLWNVKRIRPKELGPFDYTQAVRSNALWLMEGGTSYYGDLTLVRSGLWTEARYFKHLADEIQSLQTNPARKTQSVEEASRTVWDRAPGTRRVDYYNKGELLTLLLDLKIRAATDGRKSFDDVMRLLYRRTVVEPAKAGQGAIGVGFEEGAILRTVNEISGADFTEFFATCVRGTDELPYHDTFEAMGLKLEAVTSNGLDLELRGLRVQTVAPGSAAEKAGLQPGDRIAEVGGTRVFRRADLQKELDKLKVGDTVKIAFTRDDEKKEAEFPIVANTNSYVLGRHPEASEARTRFVNEWLRK
ncbi:MAG: M61 family metallopeptidase [Planctomycetes bacterium]|nr:M61 family metallopeptidase [Planctomycetota bacterium]